MLHAEFSANPVPRISWQSIQLGDLIGNGSFGDVYRGLQGERDVAVKVLQIKTLPAHLAQDFDNETRIMWQCKFDNILDLYGICTEPGHYSIIMENMSRGSLSQFLRDPQQEISKKLLWQIAIDTAEGLAYLHAKDILHRDLKSNNILLNEKYCAKISDFGLSKLKLEIKSTSTTSTAQQTGTIRWRAPELFKRGAIASKASDIYSYGMILWELVTRKLPFNDAADETTVMGWIKDGEQENIPEDCPEVWKEIITSCWSAPENRPQAKEIVARLKQAQAILTSTSTVSSQEQLRDTTMSVSTYEKSSKEANLQPVPDISSHVEKIPEMEANISKSVEKQLATNSGGKGGLAIFLEMQRVLPEPTPPSNAVLFSPAITIKLQYLAKFLKHIGFGEQDEAEAMLKENRDLALIPGDLTDCAGRQFKQITGFQYAVWALDWHMWEMLQRYLPQEEVKKQLDDLETGFWVKEHGAQTSWQNLIEAFQTYIANYDKWSDKQCRTHWLQQIGGAQLLLPAHVINEYNRPDRSFYPCPEFKELILPRTGVQNWKTHGSSKWQLGRDFAWVRGELTSGCVFSAEAGTIATKEQWFARIVNIVVAPDTRTCTPCEYDPVALTTLFFSRQAQRAQLISLFKRIAPITTTSSSSSSHVAATSASSTIIISPQYVPPITLQPNTSSQIQNQQQTQTIETERLKVEPAQAAEITILQTQLEQVKITSSASYSLHSFPQNSPVLSPAPNLSTSSIMVNFCDLNKFLKHIGFGEQDEAETMLKINPRLALTPDNLTDCAGRQFKQITGFQYAVWALDWHMWNMLRKYIPEELVKQQLMCLETGVWFKEHGAQANWQNLIDALQNYITYYEKWDEEKCESYWCKQVGGAQLLLPAHVINEYCRSDRSFSPCPEFKELNLPRIGISDWSFKGGYALGRKFAWMRREWPVALECKHGAHPMTAQHRPPECKLDHHAMSSLFECRSLQRAQLISSLGVTIIAQSTPITTSLSSSRTTSSSSITINIQTLAKFLKHIGFGEQDEAEAMLKENSELALASGNLIDCVGRQFQQISGFQYAIWALDWHMWKMIYKYMPEDAVKTQITDLERGVCKEHGIRISWENLIEALQIYCDNYGKWNYNQCNRHWCKQVGGAQLLLPAHVISEYSRLDRSFHPCPAFNEDSLPRRGCDDWKFSGWGGLGDVFAWRRGGREEGLTASPHESSGGREYACSETAARIDATALKALFETRVRQYLQLTTVMLAATTSSSSHSSYTPPLLFSTTINNQPMRSMNEAQRRIMAKVEAQISASLGLPPSRRGGGQRRY